MLATDLSHTVRKLADLLVGLEDAWWVLGSAAMALKGYDPGDVRGVDVLVSARDAVSLMTRFGLQNENDGGSSRYRSTYFLKPKLGPLPVEIMADYEIYHLKRWRSVWPDSRHPIRVSEVEVYVPSDEDLLDTFRWLDRAKDQQRIQTLEQKLRLS